MTYERLEFLGDAYLELCASRLIFSRFNHLPAGQMSQLRELLVKNETLAEYSRAYGFLERLSVGDREKMERDSKGKGNKGLNKVLGDVFEAYVAAVVLSDDQNGYAVVEKWLSELWAPKLLGAARSDKLYGMRMAKHEDQPSNPEQIYDPEAKGKLQRRVTMNNMIKLDYEAWKPTVELKGDKIGQNVHYIALYFTGFEYEKKLLAKGEGKNKVEAGNWAAMDAMYGSSKEFVEEMEQRVAAEKERRKKMK
jgi:ribonuclease-3